MMRTFLIAMMLLGFILGVATAQAYADTDNFMVLGIITSTDSQPGVALMKDMQGERTFAVRVGNSFSNNMVLKSVNRKTIEVVMNGKVYVLRVGDETSNAQIAFASLDNQGDTTIKSSDIERDGDTIKLPQAVRDHIVNNQLGNILMQAASVPYMANGHLAGFTLWDIEPNSVFELAGLKNGDTVTAINGQPITDVGMTIRLLSSLRTQKLAVFDFLRNGHVQKLNVSVQ